VGTAAGTTFAHGAYRLHSARSAGHADGLVTDAFPDFIGRIGCFGFDWLGRQFSLDPSRGPAEDPEVLLFDVGAGEALEIPVRFSNFHDEELVEYTDAALAIDFFRSWRQQNPNTLTFDTCVGYRVPLFLSGEDNVGNLELTDIDVYWTLTGQMRLSARQ
jgi:Domain of unknown function (DUF1851)